MKTGGIHDFYSDIKSSFGLCDKGREVCFWKSEQGNRRAHFLWGKGTECVPGFKDAGA